MRRSRSRAIGIGLSWTLVLTASLRAQTAQTPQTPVSEPPPEKKEPQAKEEPQAKQEVGPPTGLPPGISWKFGFDATWGTFGFANSLFQNPKEGVQENLSDQWLEGSMKPALSGGFKFKNTSEIYGKVSAAGERTYASVPELVGPEISSFQVEDLSLGWRSGTAFDLGENVFDVIVGRAPFRLGHGLLLYDGASEGGSRGGYWSNVRKAFQFASIARFQPGPHKAETFYLDRDELPEHDTGTRLWGANYEYAFGEHSTVGATYMKLAAHPDMSPGRDGLNVFNARAYTSPLQSLPGLGFEFEYASERNGDVLHSDAWTLQGSYGLEIPWKPKLTYRFAWFQGDDPATTRSEAFDPLLLGFSDWGTWWQGEIAGEYFVSNSNLASHLIRAHVTPNDSIGGGLMFYKFRLDQPATFGTGVTDKNLAFEMDAYTDWKVNRNFTVSLVAAFAAPGEAVKRTTGRTANFGLGMLYFAYSY